MPAKCPPDQGPVPQLIDNLAAVGLPVRADEKSSLKERFQAVPYAFASTYPCVEYKSSDPFQPVPGDGMTVYFNPSVLGFQYTITVVDITADPPVVVYQYTDTYGTSPAAVDIPNKVGGASTFVAGHDYMIILYPSFTASLGGVDVIVPIGCITSVAKTTSDSVFTKTVFAAAEFGPMFKH